MRRKIKKNLYDYSLLEWKISGTAVKKIQKKTQWRNKMHGNKHESIVYSN